MLAVARSAMMVSGCSASRRRHDRPRARRAPSDAARAPPICVAARASSVSEACRPRRSRSGPAGPRHAPARHAGRPARVVHRGAGKPHRARHLAFRQHRRMRRRRAQVEIIPHALPRTRRCRSPTSAASSSKSANARPRRSFSHWR